jgi:hypothetical protein
MAVNMIESPWHTGRVEGMRISRTDLADFANFVAFRRAREASQLSPTQ